MKLLSKLLPVLTLIFLLISCSTDDLDDIYGSDEYYMTASVERELYEVRGSILCTYNNISGIITINSAYPDASKQISLTIVNYQGPGNYPIKASGDTFGTGQYTEDNLTYGSIYTNPYGSITITNHDTDSGTLKGEFAFKGKQRENDESKMVSGSFKCNNFENINF